jgi:S1-C subfamily serine protease
MRRCLIALSLGVSLFAHGAALAAPPGYADAEARFERLTVEDRILAQVPLVAAGYSNAVPTEHFTTRAFRALQAFQADNGYVEDGRPTAAEIDRLIALGGAKLTQWGFRKITHPDRPVTIWVPLGLGLEVKAIKSGLHFKDPQGRIGIDFLSVRNVAIDGVYEGLLEKKIGEGATVHFKVIKDGWFVISTTTPDGFDHYYRYHQDGSAVTGFALEWNNAAGNVNGERIATLMSGSLWSAMTGEPFIDPPGGGAQARTSPAPQTQPAAVPVQPRPAPEPKVMVSTVTGFFVTEDGHFVTNAHVVEGCTSILVKADDGAVTSATRVATDTTNDLALLKLDKKPPRVVALRIGGRLGEGVEAFGFPHSDILSTSGNFTLGNITAMNGMGDDSRYLQMSAPVQAGNSGGPLLDQSGNLVGVVSAKLDAMKVAMEGGDLPQNVNFAVKSAMVAAFLDANRIAYKVGAPGPKAMEPADIADAARAMSGFVMCK